MATDMGMGRPRQQQQRPSQAEARARIGLSGTRALYSGPALDLAPHRNTAVTVAIAVQTPFELEFLEPSLESGDGALSRRVALIPSETLHHLRASGEMVFVYVDPLSDDRAALMRLDLEALERHLAAQSQFQRRSHTVQTWCDMLGLPTHATHDARIAEVISRLEHQPQCFERVADAARCAGLSTSRFQHLFKHALGVGFRRYRLWKRMAAVMRCLAAGQTLTAAAYASGFASSAHLSTAFRAMFGLTPSRLNALGVRIELTDEFARPTSLIAAAPRPSGFAP